MILFGSISSFSQITNSTTNIVYLNDVSITTITTTIISSNLNNTPAPLIVASTPVVATIQSTNVTTTAATNILQVMGVSSNVQKISANFINNFIDAEPYLKNNIINLDLAAVYNISTNRMGYFMGFDIPVGSQAAVGAGAIEFGKDWYLAPVNLKLGTTIDYPYIGNVYNYIAIDPLLSLSDGKYGAYDFLGAFKEWDISSKFQFSLGGGFGDISFIKGLDIAGTLRLDYHW